MTDRDADVDAVVIGSGPNGLAAAVALAQSGLAVTVVEAEAEIGGGTRTAELTLPGFRHDVCSACHPMGILSPFFASLPLEAHDLSDIVERQIERFAPGFRDVVLARHTLNTADLERGNPAYVGGAVTGGVADLGQLFTRPVARWNPYTTPNPKLFICSASTPPGGGVHGMCGFFAARAVLARLGRRPPSHQPR